MANEKERIELEYMVNIPASILFNRLASPSGLTEWFADNVIVKGQVYTFIWEGSQQTAEQTLRKENKMVRYQYLDEGMEGCWFEFRINVDDLTGEVALIVIDHVDPDEKEDVTDLWNQQIEALKHGLGT